MEHFVAEVGGPCTKALAKAGLAARRALKPRPAASAESRRPRRERAQQAATLLDRQRFIFKLE
jgi:hypothetical protein